MFFLILFHRESATKSLEKSRIFRYELPEVCLIEGQGGGRVKVIECPLLCIYRVKENLKK